MVKTSTPELKAYARFYVNFISLPMLDSYMDKKVYLQLNGNRKVTGVLRGFDPFLNVVLDDANELDKKTDQVKAALGTVVRLMDLDLCLTHVGRLSEEIQL